LFIYLFIIPVLFVLKLLKGRRIETSRALSASQEQSECADLFFEYQTLQVLLWLNKFQVYYLQIK